MNQALTSTAEEFCGHSKITHEGAQVSDLLNCYLTATRGTEETNPGISQGFRVGYLRDGGVSLRDKRGNFVVPVIELKKDLRTSFCGVGRGRDDEHGKDIIDCEATLYGARLGLIREATDGDSWSNDDPTRFTIRMKDGKREKTFIVSDPKLRDLFKAVATDDIKGSPSYSLGNIISTLYMRGRDPDDVMNFAFLAFIAGEAAGPIPKSDRTVAHAGAVALIRSVLDEAKESKLYVPEAFGRIERFLAKNSGEHPHFDPLNLIDSVALMIGRTWSKETEAWAWIAVKADLEEQNHFHTMTRQEVRKAELRPVKIRIRDGAAERVEDRVIAVIRTDDPLAHKYLMGKNLGYNAAAVVQQNSKGQVQIFPGSYEWTEQRGRNKSRKVQAPLKFHMGYLTVVVRDLERRAKNMTPALWSDLITDDGPKDETSWFYYSRTGWLMNSSLTAPDVPGTELLLETIADLAVEAFDDRAGDVRGRKVRDLKSWRG